MTGSATYAHDVDVAVRARALLDDAAEAVSRLEQVQREVISQLVALWPMSGWKAAGLRSAKHWLHAHTGQSWAEARRLAAIAKVCARDRDLAGAVITGRLPMGWAARLARAVTDERAPYLTPAVLESFIAMADAGVEDLQFSDALRYWKERVDELVGPRRVQPHSLVAYERLFGGGEVHMALAPVAFETFMTAIDAFTADPDPTDAPIQRTLSERRADAADDLASFGLTHGGGSDDGCTADDPDSWMDDDEDPDGVFDGTTPDDRDLYDELLDEDPAWDDADEPDRREPEGWNPFAHSPTATSGPDDDGRPAPSPTGERELAALRRLIRRRVTHQRRRARRQTRPRSGARVNAHIDLDTLAGTRELHDFDGLVLRGEGWNLARTAAEQLLCDSTLVATLFRGNRILDANADAEHFTARQRRAIAARDRHCVFPGCTRPPKHCDAHHLHERNDDGPTITANGCLLCRFHHRLLHQYGWTLHHTDDGWVATDPHGSDWAERRPANPAAAGAHT